MTFAALIFLEEDKSYTNLRYFNKDSNISIGQKLGKVTTTTQVLTWQRR